jgi:hypothetical protein
MSSLLRYAALTVAFVVGAWVYFVFVVLPS